MWIYITDSTDTTTSVVNMKFIQKFSSNVELHYQTERYEENSRRKLP